MDPNGQNPNIHGVMTIFQGLLIGGIPTPLKHMKVSWGYDIPNKSKQLDHGTYGNPKMDKLDNVNPGLINPVYGWLIGGVP